MIAFSCRIALLTAAIAGCALTARADINGFGNGTGYTLNGGATINSGTATLTTFDSSNPAPSQARSVFYNTPQRILDFATVFTYQDVTGGGGEGFTFTLQNDPRGPAAVSNDGGKYGYGSSNSSVSPQLISPSAAVEFNISANTGGSRTGFGANGSVNTGTMSSTTPVNLASGDLILVRLTYDGSFLLGTFTDLNTNAVSSVSYGLRNLSAMLGSNTAYVGFTGGSAALVSTQQVSNFVFIPEPSAWGLTLLGGAGMLLAVRRTARKV